MHTWTENNGSLAIDYRSGGGCKAYIVLGIFCVMFILIASFMSLIVLSLDFSRILKVLGMLVLCLFGLLCGIAIFRNLRKDFTLQAMLEIDSHNETMSLYNTDTKSDLQLGLGDFDHIRIKKVRVLNPNRGTHLPRYDYQIFLIKQNGSAFWLDTQHEAQKEPFSNYIDQLTSFVGLEVKDFTEFELDRPATQTYTNVIDAKYTPSKWVVELHDAKGTIFTLKSKRSVTNALVSILIYSFFFLVPAIMVAMYRDMEAPLILNLGALVVGLAYVTGILLFALTQFKRYILRLEQDALAIRLAFVFPIFDRIFGRLLNIPKDAIQNASVHRTANGHFWLALGITSFSVPTTDKVLFGAGAFQKQGLDDINQDESLIGLWEISGWRHNKSTTPQDLSYIADRIHNQYLKTS